MTSYSYPEGQRKRITVLFSDISSYTALSERLDPEEVKEITTRIFGKVASIVSRYDGFIEKYIGDAVVALFGVPQLHEDDHLRALRAARDIHESIDGIGGQYEQKIGCRLAFHSGISTGLVVTGQIDMEKGTHGVAGDTVNIAALLCGLAKPGEIVVSESTYLESMRSFSFEKLTPAIMKGKSEAVIHYRLVETRRESVRGLAAPTLTSPLVGRHVEVTAIRDRVSRLFDGQGGLLFVVGEAGLGKSRLMAEVRKSFADERLLWLEGHTLSYGQKMSYWPFREILWHYSGIMEEDTDTEAWNKLEGKIADLFPADGGEILPYLAGLIGLEVKGELAKSLAYIDGESVGRQIYRSSRRFFERLAKGRPLVLVFEDLHWADESTVALIAHLFPLVTRVPLLICGVSRPEIGVPATRLRYTALKDHKECSEDIRLNPLSSTESVDLMDNLIAITNLSSRARQLILNRADGNPFFLEEIVRSLIDREAVRYENGHWRAIAKIESITIPETIHGVITARIDRLGEELKQVLRTASVIGRAFPYRLLKEVAEGVEELDDHLDTLTAAELIRERQRTPELEYIFKHALVQESTYESILLKKRHELHGRVACAIESLFADRLEEFFPVLAYHYAKAEDWERAQEYLFKAGDQAGRIAADAEGLVHYEKALESYSKVFGDKWDPVQRGILERKMGEAFYRRGEYERAMEYLQRALVHFGRPRLPSVQAKVRSGILKEIGVQVAHRLFERWIGKKGKEALDQAASEVYRTYLVMGWILVLTDQKRMFLGALTSLNYAERAGYSYGVAETFGAMGQNSLLLSLPRFERFYWRKGLALAQRLERPEALITCYMIEGACAHIRGDLQRAVELGSKAAEIGRREHHPSLPFSSALGFTAWAHLYLGNIDSAAEIASETMQMGEDSNDPCVYVIGSVFVGSAQYHRGQLTEAIATAQKTILITEGIQAHSLRVLAGTYLSLYYLSSGDMNRALDALTQTHTYGLEHEERLNWHHVPVAFLRVYLAAAEGGGPDKGEWLRKARSTCKEALRIGRVRRVILPETARLQGVNDWLIGRRDSARKHWQRGLFLAERMGMRYDFAMTLREMGKRLDDHGYLRRAEAIFKETGALFDLAETKRLLAGGNQ